MPIVEFSRHFMLLSKFMVQVLSNLAGVCNDRTLLTRCNLQRGSHPPHRKCTLPRTGLCYAESCHWKSQIVAPYSTQGRSVQTNPATRGETYLSSSTIASAISLLLPTPRSKSYLSIDIRIRFKSASEQSCSLSLLTCSQQLSSSHSPRNSLPLICAEDHSFTAIDLQGVVIPGAWHASLDGFL